MGDNALTAEELELAGEEVKEAINQGMSSRPVSPCVNTVTRVYVAA